MTTTQLLERAIKRIKQGWTQKATARDSCKQPAFSDSPPAVRWSLIGSLMCPIRFTYQQAKAWEYFPKEIQDRPTTWNNDPERTQEDVLLLLRNALREHRRLTNDHDEAD